MNDVAESHSPDEDGEETVSLMRAMQRLSMSTKIDGDAASHASVLLPGPASHHWTSHFEISARPFTDGPAVQALFERDPHTMRLCALRVFHDGGLVVGLRASYLCLGRVEPLKTHLSFAARAGDVQSLQSELLTLRAGEGILRLGVGFDDRSKLQQLHVITTHGNSLLIPRLIPEPFRHYVDVLPQPHGRPHDLIVFCAVKQHRPFLASLHPCTHAPMHLCLCTYAPMHTHLQVASLARRTYGLACWW